MGLGALDGALHRDSWWVRFQKYDLAGGGAQAVLRLVLEELDGW